MKYILVTGGVISGIGKGIISSSLGTIMKACGLRVTSIKIDPYINIDAGTFSPYEHGEVFVLDDGGEVDLDLGNYERFLDVTLTKDNNITTGKIYESVIQRERRGDYLGKTVQVVPHITDTIQEWVERVACTSVDQSKEKPEVCIIELGGTVGDIESMPFIEAFRQFQFRVGKNNFACVHVSLLPQPKTTGEMKTKPTQWNTTVAYTIGDPEKYVIHQMSVRELRGLGLSPDLLMCRSTGAMPDSVVEKLSMFCHVPVKQVICVPDVSTLYRVPLLLERQKVPYILCEHFQLARRNPRPRRFLVHWKELADRMDNSTNVVKIALVGKYIQLEDSYTSVIKSLNHSALYCNMKLELQTVSSGDLEPSQATENPVRYHRAWEKVCTADGVLVPGGFGMRGVEGKIAAIKWCREQKRPLLGVCLGMQCMVIEYSRNVLAWKDANSTEFDPETTHPVIIDMPEFNPGSMGGTMRLGLRRTLFCSPGASATPKSSSDNTPSTLVLPNGDTATATSQSIMQKLYRNRSFVEERHRHRYEVNPKYIEKLEQHGLHFVGRDTEGERMEILEMADHPYMVAVQYHPEYLSRPLKPSPPYLGLVLAASGQLSSYLRNGCRLSPRNNSFLEEEDDEGSSIMTETSETMQKMSLECQLPVGNTEGTSLGETEEEEERDISVSSSELGCTESSQNTPTHQQL